MFPLASLRLIRHYSVRMMSQIEASMSAVDKKLQDMGITLPTPAAPVANYVPFVRTGNLIIISGPALPRPRRQARRCPQGQARRGDLARGRTRRPHAFAPSIFSPSSKAAVGDLDNVTRCVRLGGFINAVPTFAALAPVMNGASDLMVEVLGDAGRHARSTIGVAELPLDACVEVEGMFEVK